MDIGQLENDFRNYVARVDFLDQKISKVVSDFAQFQTNISQNIVELRNARPEPIKDPRIDYLVKAVEDLKAYDSLVQKALNDIRAQMNVEKVVKKSWWPF